MKRHLFFTGPIGCGKSTAIQAALGENLCQCGGFLTRRYRQPHLHFTLESPDGKWKETFLDFSFRKPELHLQVFSEVSFQSSVLVMDEIGGIDLLNPDFASALETVLNSNTPILGVIKGESAASALIKTLDLTERYTLAASRLRDFLSRDPHTLLYECSQFDENARLLARQWAEEYLHD